MYLQAVVMKMKALSWVTLSTNPPIKTRGMTKRLPSQPRPSERVETQHSVGES
jgi:hypothetical protein